MRERTLFKRFSSILLAFVMAVVMITPSTALAKGDVSADKPAPEVAAITEGGSIFAKTYQVSFKEDETKQVAANYVAALKGEDTTITLNGAPAKRVTSFFNDTKSYKFSNDPSFGGSDIYVDFTTDCFAGTVNVVFKTKGYTDLAFTVIDGVLQEGSNPGPVDPDPNPNPDPEGPETGKLVTATKNVDLGWAKFLVVDLEDEYNMDNVKFVVDGTEVEPTKVTDDGNIVKWEVSALDHKDLVVKTNDGKVEEKLVIGKEAGKVVNNGKTLPDYFMANGPVYTWDYQLRNFDDAGNVRVTPAKTTFDMDGKVTPIVKHFSPDAELIEDEASEYGVTGEVQLMFNYEKGTEAEKEFVNGIQDVDLVNYNENKNTLNDELEFTLDKNFVHGDHTVACVKVPLGQKNFYAAGRYYLRVTSNGNSTLFPIHVVNSVTPSMTLITQKPVSGQDVKFRVNDMTFGITMPIYRVTLTDPEGNTTELNKIDDYYLIGDLFTLYNTQNNHIEKSGTYTIDVYATGFKPFSKKFAVGEAAKTAPAKAMSLDGIATASIGGGDSEGGSGEAGDTDVMNANLIFNTDLLVNAEIFVAMGIDNPFATAIADRWNSMTAVSVYNAGAEKVYDAASYFDAVNTARTEDKYLTFNEYSAREDAKLTVNRPYSVKQVLEDNLLGDVTSFGEAAGKMAPDMALSSVDGHTVVFNCEDVDYLRAIDKNGEISLNGTSILSKDKYSVDYIFNKTLTIKDVKYGENTLTINVPGYKVFKMVFECKKVNEVPELQITGSKVGADVVIECKAHNNGEACDFLANLKAVSVVAPSGLEHSILPKGQETNETGYVKDGNKLTILGKSFTEKWAQDAEGNLQAGEYKVVLVADTYEDEQTLSVNLAKDETPVIPDVEAKDAPAVAAIERDGDIFAKYDKVTFVGETDDVDRFVKAIKKVTVNGNEVVRSNTLHAVTNSYTTGIVDGYGRYLELNFSTDCFEGKGEVVISANGYNDLVFNVEAGKLVTGDVTPDPKPEPEPEKPAIKLVAPTGLKVTGTDQGILKIVVDKVEGLQYKFYVRKVGNEKWVASKIKDANTVTFTGLTKNAKYQVKAVTVLDGKESKATVMKGYVWTNRVGSKAAAMYKPVIKNVTIKNRVAKITVNKVNYNKAQYALGFKKAGAKDFKWFAPNAKTVKTVKNLKKGVKYTFTMRYQYTSKVSGTIVKNNKWAKYVTKVAK